MVSGIRLSQINCFLTDRNGNILDPYRPNAIRYSYTLKCTAKKPSPLSSCKPEDKDKIEVTISGYISVFLKDKRISESIPFSANQTLLLCMPHGADLLFRVNCFECCLYEAHYNDDSLDIEIQVMLETVVRSAAQVDLIVPFIDSPDGCEPEAGEGCITVTRVFDKVIFTNEIIIATKEEAVEAEVYQYNAVSTGTKREFTNEDEIIQYGDQGILDPNAVSYYFLYINGVLQPDENYDLEAGKLTLKTDDIPIPNAPVVISFVTFRDKGGTVLQAEASRYFAVSDGIKREFTDGDAINDGGRIIDPQQASFMNLYINGVMQPAVNYTVKEGLLTLLTADIPQSRVIIALEFITIMNASGQILKAKNDLYNAYAHAQKTYTNSNAIAMYGNTGILNPDSVSYYSLFINAVIQPSVTYSVQEGLLILTTDDIPMVGSPITLQFITISSRYAEIIQQQPHGSCRRKACCHALT